MTYQDRQTFLQGMMKQAAAELLAPAGGNQKTDPTNTVNNAANECHPGETAVNNTVQTHAEPLPTKPAGKTKRRYKKHKVDVTQWQTSTCEQCGGPMTVKRSIGPKRKRFCSGACRVAAHRARHEAGGGRVDFALLMLKLILVVGAVWFFWPLLSDLAAMRPTLAPTPTAVPAYVETWPDPAPTAVPVDLVPQAAPDPTVTAVSPAPAIVTSDVKPAPTAVPVDLVPQAAPATAVYIELPTAVPPQPQAAATAGAALLHITAGGKVYELTGERLVDCINSQAAGRRTGPSCPPNAAQYAGMLGQGR